MSEPIIFKSIVPRGSSEGPTEEEMDAAYNKVYGKGVANRPVDMSEEFRKNGWEHCKYLITDPRSDHYLKKREGE
tara:strand:- start:1926 stop:2150 length:225 start_codon:yes stop_codon:yes gene_type:complete